MEPSSYLAFLVAGDSSVIRSRGFGSFRPALDLDSHRKLTPSQHLANTFIQFLVTRSELKVRDQHVILGPSSVSTFFRLILISSVSYTNSRECGKTAMRFVFQVPIKMGRLRCRAKAKNDFLIMRNKSLLGMGQF
ncbi:hypothetical protein ONS95_013045 [Cadophora gregata]|uniref:uncharacterized protein n=1 Tax=Cadophora gregata TaxID=51156 RepID=UPI0026DC1CF3|nr:uncharacterized protein ONS95_013045 [Cadophora gregata]KAK0100966.1 hypothetical protein ONS96_006198 [Cadophora gregata f. sp. sojae]KAK0116008.1 hypothetical protein ONS95_013045 [Cadophora gregata]